MKVKKVFFFLITIILFGFITFQTPLKDHIIKSLLSYYCDGKCDYDRLYLHNNRVVLKNFSYKRKELDLSANNIELAFGWIEKKLSLDIVIDNTSITANRDDINFDFLLKSRIRRRKIINTQILVQKGQFHLKKDTSPVIFFNCHKKDSFIHLALDAKEIEEKAINIDIKKEDLQILARVNANHIVLEQYSFLFNDQIINAKGLVDGFINFKICNDQLLDIQSNISINDFIFILNQQERSIGGKHFDIKMLLPSVNNLKKINLDQGKIEASFSHLFLLEERDKPLLSSLDGKLNYQSLGGLKAEIVGCSSVDSIIKPFDFFLFGDSHFSSLKAIFHVLGKDNVRKVSLDVKEIENNKHLVRANIKKVDGYILDLFSRVVEIFFPSLNKYQLHADSFNATIELEVGNRRISNCKVKHFNAKNLSFLTEDKCHISQKNIFGQFSIEKDISSLCAQLHMKEGCMDIAELYHFNSVQGDIVIDNGVIHSSYFSGYFNDMFWEMDCSGAVDEFTSQWKLQPQLKEFKKFFPKIPKEIEQKKIITSFSFRKNKGKVALYGHIKCLQERNEELASFGIEMDLFKDFLKDGWMKNISIGWLRSEHICLDQWSFLYDIISGDKNFSLHGLADMALFLRGGKFYFYLKGEDLSISTPSIKMDIGTIGKKGGFHFQQKDNLFCCIDYKTKQWEIASPLMDIEINLLEKEIKAKSYKTKCSCKKEKVLLTFEKVVVNDLTMYGDIKASQKTGLINFLQFNINHFSGDLSSFHQILSQYFPFLTKIYGNIEGQFKVDAFIPSKEYEVFINSRIDNATAYLKDDVKIKQLSASLLLDTLEDIMLIDQVEGEVVKDDSTYPLRVTTFAKDKNKLKFDLALEKEIDDLLRLKGEIIDNNSIYLLNLDPLASHFSQMNINLGICEIDKKGKLLAFDCEAKCNKNALLQIANLCSKHLSILQELSFPVLYNHVVFKENIWHFYIDGKNISYKGIDLGAFSIKASKIGDEIIIDKGQLKDVFIDGKINKNINNNIAVNLNVTTLFAPVFSVEGIYLKDEKKINCTLNDITINPFEFVNKVNPVAINQNIKGSINGNGFISIFWSDGFEIIGDLDVLLNHLSYHNIKIENPKPINIHYSSKEGVMIYGIDLFMEESFFCRAKQISINPKKKKGLIQEAHIHIPVEMLYMRNSLNNKSKLRKLSKLIHLIEQMVHFERDIDIKGNMMFLCDLSYIQIFAKEGDFFINKKNRHIKDLFLEYDKESCKLNFLWDHQNHYYQIENHIDLSSPMCGFIQFIDPIDKKQQNPLTVYWSQKKKLGFIIEAIKGNFCGIESDLFLKKIAAMEKSITLSGKLSVDMEKVKPLLMPSISTILEKISAGGVININGESEMQTYPPLLKNFSFVVSSKDLQMKGYIFKTLLFNIKGSLEDIEIKGFELSDLAGGVVVPTIFAKQSNDQWHWLVPYIRLSNFRPSKLQKIGSIEQKPIKPFQIRSMEFRDLQGILNHNETVRGEGEVYFINSFKRGNSIFDVPSDVLGSIIGLDPHLFIPVKGKIDFYIQDQKCYFSQMNDAYSENNRSKFFLSEKESSYLDFKGNLSLHIKMKQYVLFKLTENFIISIIGPVNHPHVHFHKK